jgi:exosome complex component RRP4
MTLIERGSEKPMSKEIVVPGELLTDESKQIGVHTFAREGKIYADCLGIKNESDDRISVVPLRGKYLPVENDVVIGVVKNEKFAGYDIEINSFYPSFVSNKDMREPLKVGSVISAKIVKVNEMNEADLGMVRPLNEGEVVSVTPVKVPRIIGKNASMLNAVKNGTGSSIMVGRNGLVWIHGGNTQVAAETILRIEEYSHAENLTHDIQCFLAARTGTGMPDTKGPSNEDAFETGFSGGGGGFGRGRDFGGRGGGFRPRGNFSRGPPRSGGGFGGGRERGGFGGDRPRSSGGFGGGFSQGPSRGPRMDGGFGGGRNRMNEGTDSGDRGFGGGRERGGFGDNRSSGFRPRNNFNRSFGERNNDEGFQMNKRFGRQYDNPQVGSDFGKPSFDKPGFEKTGFDKRKRFPRDERAPREPRIRGDEDPMFE